MRPHLNLKGKTKKGYIVDSILQEIDKLDPELVVIGTLGASNIAKRILGSTEAHLGGIVLNKAYIL